MAEKRMFSQKIIDSDAFIDMPLSTQAVYFHLSMRADDEGFINNPKKILRMIGASEDEIKLLIAKRFILDMESGVVVIKHWFVHNYIRKDRIKPTSHIEEKSRLVIKDNDSYTECQAGVSQVSDNGQPRLDKVSLDKVSLDKSSIDTMSIKKIVGHLNEVSNKSFKHTTAKTISCIKARFNEGFTLDDFIVVIDKKVNQWINDPKMNQFIRPETIFGNKFESYLQQEVKFKSNEPEPGSAADIESRMEKFIDTEVIK